MLSKWTVGGGTRRGPIQRVAQYYCSSDKDCECHAATGVPTTCSQHTHRRTSLNISRCTQYAALVLLSPYQQLRNELERHSNSYRTRTLQSAYINRGNTRARACAHVVTRIFTPTKPNGKRTKLVKWIDNTTETSNQDI